MTSTTPIHSQTAATGPGLVSQAASAQSSAQAGGLMGFLTTLLQNNGVAAAQNPLAGTQGAAEAAQDLAAKISDLLAQNGGKLDAATLQQIMPADMAQAIADKLAALQQFISPVTQDAAPVAPTLLGETPAPTLTSDLTSATATTAQDEALLKTLAEQLNAIGPGSKDLPADETALGETKAEEATAAAEQAISDAVNEEIVVVKDDMMATLLAMQAEDTTTQPSLALQAADTSAKTLRAAPAAAKQSPLLASSDEAGSSTREASAHIDINTETNARAPKQTPTINTPAASLTAQMQQVAPQAVQNNTFNGMLGSSLGTLNSLLSGDGSFGGGLDQGFGGQHGLAGDTTALDGMSADARLAAGTGSFTTYMSAAAKAAGQSATTQMVGVQISRNANAKIDTFTMQLEPADLGALEVRMSFGKDGKVSARLIADKPETLSMLQRDSMQLERILQQAGLDVGENALSFDLRDQSQQSLYDGTGASRDDNMYAGRGDHAHRNSNEITAQLAVQAAGYISQTGVNIMV